MSSRLMWKMVHLLHQYGRPGLSRDELFRAGIDCNTDTIQPLLHGQAVEEGPPGEFHLSRGAQKLLEVCMVAHRGGYGGNVRVGYPHAFVVVPFSQPWSAGVFARMIEPAVLGAGLDCTRGDTAVRVGALAANVWDQIVQAGLVIAEVSAANVNVFYELGLAHA